MPIRSHLAPVGAALLSFSLHGAAVAQTADAKDGDDAVLAPIHALFDGMREKDSEKILGAFAEGAMLWGTGWTEEGEPHLGRPIPIPDFAARVGQAEAHLDERIWDPVVHVDDNFASAWVKYVFYVDGALSHCGVDSFHLFKSPEGWKIFHVADTRRTENCWEPSQ